MVLVSWNPRPSSSNPKAKNRLFLSLAKSSCLTRIQIGFHWFNSFSELMEAVSVFPDTILRWTSFGFSVMVVVSGSCSVSLQWWVGAFVVLSAADCCSVRVWRTGWGSCWSLPRSCSLDETKRHCLNRRFTSWRDVRVLSWLDLSSHLIKPWTDGTRRLGSAGLPSLLPRPETSHKTYNHHQSSWNLFLLYFWRHTKTVFCEVTQRVSSADCNAFHQGLRCLTGWHWLLQINFSCWGQQISIETEKIWQDSRIVSKSISNKEKHCLWLQSLWKYTRSITQCSQLCFLPCRQGPTPLDGQWKHIWLPRPAISIHHFLSWFLRPNRPRSCPEPCPRSLTAHQSVGGTAEVRTRLTYFKETVHKLPSYNLSSRLHFHSPGLTGLYSSTLKDDYHRIIDGCGRLRAT